MLLTIRTHAKFQYLSGKSAQLAGKEIIPIVLELSVKSWYF